MKPSVSAPRGRRCPSPSGGAFAALGLLCAAPSAAWAQSVPRECQTLSATEPAPQSSEPREREAELRQWRALRLFCVGSYEASSAEFEALYALREGNPNRYRILFFLGRNAERLRRYDEAVRTYQRYLEQAPADAPNREALQSAIETLTNLLGTVEVRVARPGAELWIDDRRAGDAPSSVRLAGGRHVVEVRAPGFSPSRREVTVEAGRTVTVQLTLEALSARRGLPVGAFGAAVAITGAAALATVGLGVAVVVEHGRGEGLLNSAANMAQWTTADADHLRSLALATDVTLGVTVVLAAATAVVGRFTEFRRPEGVASARRPRVGVAPLLGSATGLSVGGAW